MTLPQLTMAGRFYVPPGQRDNKSGLGRGLLGSSPPRFSGASKVTTPANYLSSRVFVANVPVESVQRMQLHSMFSKYGVVTGWYYFVNVDVSYENFFIICKQN